MQNFSIPFVLRQNSVQSKLEYDILTIGALNRNFGVFSKQWARISNHWRISLRVKNGLRKWTFWANILLTVRSINANSILSIWMTNS